MGKEYELDDNVEYMVKWISDLKHIKNSNTGEYFMRARVFYKSLFQTHDYRIVDADVNLLFDKVIGSIVKAKGKYINVVRSNPEISDQYHIFNVGVESLKEFSKPIFNHLGFNKNNPFINSKEIFNKNVSEPLSFKDEQFAFSYAHKIKCTSRDSDIDFFLVPSYEIFRFFFLKGSTLTKELFQYFTTDDEKANLIIKSLYFHTSNGKSINVDKSGKRVANLAIKRGLSNVEKECLFRIAFIENAFECIELIRECIYDNFHANKDSNNSKAIYDKIKTILPQNLPFAMAVFGQKFTWDNSTYLLVNQIYDTRETLPYDKISFTIMEDYKIIASKRNSPNGSSINQKSSSIATSPSQLTSDILGNDDSKANIEIKVKSGFKFDNEVIEIERLSPTEQIRVFGIETTNLIEREFLSICEGIGVNKDVGRAKTSNINDFDENDERRMKFLNAIKQINSYEITYFELSSNNTGYVRQSTVIRKMNNDNYNLIICQVKSKDGRYCYIVRADNSSNDKARYGFFRTPILNAIDPASFRIIAFDLLKIYGLSFTVDRLNKYKFIHKSFLRHNQSQYSAERLSKKMEEEIEEIFR